MQDVQPLQSEFDAYAENYKAQMTHICRRFIDPKENYFVDLKCAELYRILAEFGLRSEDLVIADVGSGLGDFEARLAGRFKQLLAFDLSFKMIQVAQEVAPYSNGGYTCADSVALPLPDASIDVVFASSLFHHMPNDTMAPVLAELYRICRPGGLVVCFEHNPLNLVTQLVVRTTPIDRDARLMTSRSVRHIFMQTGFTHVTRRYLLFGPKALDIRLILLRPWLSRVPVGAQYMVVGCR